MRSERVRTALNAVNPTQEQKARMRQALAQQMGVSPARKPEAAPAREEKKAALQASAEKPKPTERKSPRYLSQGSANARRKHPNAAIWLSAAATVAVILGAGFLLKTSLTGTESQEAGPLATVEETEAEATTAQTVTLDELAGRAEYQAQREWLDYRSTAKAGADSSELSAAYQSFGCKDQADADKLDEIISAYGLTMGYSEAGSSMTMQEQADALTAADEKGNLSALVPESTPSGAYRTQEGSGTALSGDSYISGSIRSSTIWEYPVSFELYYNAEDSFSRYFPLMGSTGDYEGWSYTTSRNVSLALGLGEDSAVIYCPAESGFYLVYTEAIRVGDIQTGEHTMTREQVEAFAETFCFPQVVTEDRIAAGEARYGDALSRWKAAAQGEDSTCAEARSTAMGLGQEDYGYTFRELDGDGIDELLITDGRKLYGLYTGGDNIPLIVDSEAYSYYLTVTGLICLQYWMDESQGIVSYQYYSLADRTMEGKGGTAYTGEGYIEWNAYGTTTDISSEQYDDTIAANPHAKLSFKPLAQYSLQQEQTQADSGDTTAAGEEIYAEILQEWLSQADTAEQQVCVTGEKRPFGVERIGYLFRDLDGDGTVELLITNGTSIYSIYASDGSVILDEAYNTDTLWLCEDGTLCLLKMANGEGMKIEQASHYVVQRGKCKILEQVTASESGWGRQDENGSGMVISEEEFNETVAEIQALPKGDLSFKRLSEYSGQEETQTGSTASATAEERTYAEALAEWVSRSELYGSQTCVTGEERPYDAEKIGYLFRDLDEDGAAELLITNGSSVYAVYGPDGAVRMDQEPTNETLWLCEDNTLCKLRYAVDTADEILEASQYQIQNGGCIIISDVEKTEGGNLRNVPANDPKVGSDSISDAEYSQAVSEIQSKAHAELSFKPLSQWPGYLGLLGSDEQRNAYRAVLEKYRSAIAEGWNAGKCEQEEISVLTASASGLDELGYQCRDLDDDGRMELIVTDGSMIYGLYAMSDDGAQAVCRSRERMAYYLCTNNMIASEGSSSAAISVYEYAHLEGSRLVTDLSLMENYEENAASPWFRGSTGTDETAEPITQEEFASERAQYLRLSVLHFTPLSQLE